MSSYMTKERHDEMMKRTTLYFDREHHKELLDLNLIVTINDNTFSETPQWLLDFMQKNMEKYGASTGLRSVHAS